jgi:hypothetical protein
MSNRVSLRRKLFASTLAILLSVAIVSIPLSFAWASPISRSAVVKLTNNERVKVGASALKTNYNLTVAAQNKADDMLKNSYFEHYHNGKSPWDWMHEAGYNFSSAGENLAIDFDDAETLVTAWMNSPTHRQNLMNPNFSEIGVGIAQGTFGDHQTTIVVQMFGKPVANINLTNVNNTNQQVAGANVSNQNVDKLYQNTNNQNFFQKIVNDIKYFYSLVYSKTVGLFI